MGLLLRTATWVPRSGDSMECAAPASARALGLPMNAVTTDAAAAIPGLVDVSEEGAHGAVFVPHWLTARDGWWREPCREAGIEYLDPREDSIEVIRRIANSELVVAEAMHAAIIADAFRVPWIPVATSGEVNASKWTDWCGSLGLGYEPVLLGDTGPLARDGRSAARVRGLVRRLVPYGLRRRLIRTARSTASFRSDRCDREAAAMALHRVLTANPMLSSDDELRRARERLESARDQFLRDAADGSLDQLKF